MKTMNSNKRKYKFNKNKTKKKKTQQTWIIIKILKKKKTKQSGNVFSWSKDGLTIFSSFKDTSNKIV